jgi:hypothetical protein
MSITNVLTFLVVGPPPKLEPLAWHAIVAVVFSVLLALVGFFRGLSALSELHLQVSLITVSNLCGLQLHEMINITLPAARLFVCLLHFCYMFHPVIFRLPLISHKRYLRLLKLSEKLKYLKPYQCIS